MSLSATQQKMLLLRLQLAGFHSHNHYHPHYCNISFQFNPWIILVLSHYHSSFIFQTSESLLSTLFGIPVGLHLIIPTFVLFNHSKIKFHIWLQTLWHPSGASGFQLWPVFEAERPPGGVVHGDRHHHPPCYHRHHCHHHHSPHYNCHQLSKLIV